MQPPETDKQEKVTAAAKRIAASSATASQKEEISVVERPELACLTQFRDSLLEQRRESSVDIIEGHSKQVAGQSEVKQTGTTKAEAEAKAIVIATTGQTSETFASLRDGQSELAADWQAEVENSRLTFRSGLNLSERSNLDQTAASQKIKVTLSAPRNSRDQQSESIVLDSTLAAATATANRNGALQSGRERQSTSTLISPIGASWTDLQTSSSVESSSGTFVGTKETLLEEEKKSKFASGGSQLSRLETEKELRRIASQRVKRKTTRTSQTAKQIEEKSKRKEEEEEKRQQQQQVAPNPKQLAIYINGKIRSNSIFCRSTSNSSFNSILNRFHHNSNQQLNGSEGNEQQRESESRLLDSKESPLRLCQHNQTKCKRRKSVLPTNNSNNKERQQHFKTKTTLISHFNLSARKFLSNYLQIPSIETKKEPESAAVVGELNKPLILETSDIDEKVDVKGIDSSEQVSGNSLNKGRSFSEEETGGGEETRTSYKLNPSSMFLRKAMRYYRLWIYCANITILLGTLIFIISTIYVTSNYRIRLLISNGNEDESLKKEAEQENRNGNGTKSSSIWNDYNIYISYKEPSLLLAYLAIAVQAGILQAIGCFGAIRMKERWIQTFWYLILALTIFDVAFLLYWLNRYDFVVRSLRSHMTYRLNQQYGNYQPAPIGNHQQHHYTNRAVSSIRLAEAFVVPEEIRVKLDKILTEIIDKIQADSQCCGISSSLDYKHSNWRQIKLAQLGNQLNLTASGLTSQPGKIANFLRRVPLVPASCCRPKATSKTINEALNEESQTKRKPVILDDSQIEHPIRVPAWSPSMVVENVQEAKLRRAKPVVDEEQQEQQTGVLVNLGSDERFPNGDGDESFSDTDHEGIVSKQRRRLLAKQRNFNRDSSEEETETEEISSKRKRRWLVESRVNDEEQVLMRLIEESDHLKFKEINEEKIPLNASRNLIGLRELLFLPLIKGYSIANFRANNKLHLSYDQYKLIESYLLNEIINEAKQQQVFSGEKNGKPATTTRHKRFSIFSNLIGSKNESKDKESISTVGTINLSPDEQQKVVASQLELGRLRDEVNRLLREDPETSCAPRSYYDQATIYTQGCQSVIKSWLDSSAHILFVTGFCVLTVLKFCSVVLLRLEIREMIHKIRVLKGMATEYNALHDLEAYLPRPSVCAQAAELTPSGVTAALPNVGGSAATTIASGSGTASNQAGCDIRPQNVYRLGGSFSEAVAAAASAAANQTGCNGAGLAQSGGQSGGSFQLSSRAASMKAVAAMLAPTMYPRSASVSAAHIHAAASFASNQKYPAGNLSAFHGNASVMSRRHTAISVCPTQAAAAAAVALMSRRGTYVPNPIFTGGSGATGTPLINSGLSYHHRHSAHAVHTSIGLLVPQPRQQRHHSTGNSRQYFDNNNTSTVGIGTKERNSLLDRREEEVASGIEHQSSGDSAASQMAARRTLHSSGGSHQQLLSLVYPFKRQSSGGAQSACSFSMDLAPALLAESRRSIH